MGSLMNFLLDDRNRSEGTEGHGYGEELTTRIEVHNSLVGEGLFLCVVLVLNI